MGLLIRLAGQWVAGETLDDVVRVAQIANSRGIEAMVNFLGEHYHEKALVEATVQEYLNVVGAIRSAGIRGCVSTKPSQLGVLIGREYALSQFLVLLDAVRPDGRMLWIDMEAASTTDDTIWIYEQLHDHYDKVGLCLQANLRRTRRDLERLLERGARIRMTKGAYRETAYIAFTTRAEIDRAYLEHLETLFREGRHFAVASHDGLIIERALELAQSHNVPFEFQMLQGVRDPLKLELTGKGYRVADYIPYGPNWLPYFTRRLRERPRNVITMVRSFVSG